MIHKHDLERKENLKKIFIPQINFYFGYNKTIGYDLCRFFERPTLINFYGVMKNQKFFIMIHKHDLERKENLKKIFIPQINFYCDV